MTVSLVRFAALRLLLALVFTISAFTNGQPDGCTFGHD
jgi:hypothetical protein